MESNYGGRSALTLPPNSGLFELDILDCQSRICPTPMERGGMRKIRSLVRLLVALARRRAIGADLLGIFADSKLEELSVGAAGIELPHRLMPSFEEGETPARGQGERDEQHRGLPVSDESAIKGLHQQDVKSSLVILVELVPGQDRTIDAAVRAALERDVVRFRRLEVCCQADVDFRACPSRECSRVPAATGPASTVPR